ncbi:MAG: hypothetical protein F6K24_57575 [Okeania sp. SIO2D1]|nr:hypothetical protein [Okeania sp. SIO2D1]
MATKPEQQARKKIDQLLRVANWSTSPPKPQQLESRTMNQEQQKLLEKATRSLEVARKINEDGYPEFYDFRIGL